MKFLETPLSGAWLIQAERATDDRGWFARIRCEEEFSKVGLETRFPQVSLSFTRRRGILRGLHFQVPPRQEVKLLRCVRGKIFDVIVDLRPGSPTFKHHFSIELSPETGYGLYVPKGFAHGFLALRDDSEVLYEISEVYSQEHARGVRWDDPAFGISWPIPDPVLIDRDRDYPDFDEAILT